MERFPDRKSIPGHPLEKLASVVAEGQALEARLAASHKNRDEIARLGRELAELEIRLERCEMTLRGLMQTQTHDAEMARLNQRLAELRGLPPPGQASTDAEVAWVQAERDEILAAIEANKAERLALEG